MSSQTVSLGFTRERFPPGVHICQIFSSDAERQSAAMEFLASGLQGGERTCCFSEQIHEKELAEYLDQHGMSCSSAMDSGALSLSPTNETYFEGGRFDPERMLAMLRAYYQDAMAHGYCAARVIGEMTTEIQRLPGGSRLLEYESRVSLLLREYPISAVCQYDARSFDGATIMDVLKVHPLMVIRGEVVHNPFFISPEEYLHI